MKTFLIMLFVFCSTHAWGQGFMQARGAEQKGTLNASIAFSQGNFDEPYFNLFSTNPAAQHFEAAQGKTETFLYFYHTDPLYTPEVNARLVPKCDLLSTTCTAPNNFFNFLTNIGDPYTGCLDLNGDGFPGDAPPDIADCQTKECYYAVKAYWENLKSEIDGGDKEALLNDLYNSPEALATYQKYMTASPYLSDEVLIEAAQAELMSANHRANILLANAPLSDEAMYQIQDIVAANVYQLLYTIKYYTKLSARDNLNINISQETAKKEKLLHYLLQKYSDEKDYANLDDLLTNENTTYAVRALISSKMERDDYAAAQSLLDILPADTPEEQDYKTVQQINLQYQTTTGTAFELSASQYAQLHSIADAQGYQAPAACALLGLLRGEYCDWVLPEATESGKTEAHPRYKTAPLLEQSVLNRLSLAPNPANNSFEVTLPIYFGDQAGKVQLSDLSGKTLQTLPLTAEQHSLSVPTSDLPNGVYLVSYIADGITVSSAKVVVQH